MVYDRDSTLVRLRLMLRELYHGQTERAVRFRYGVIALDLIVIAFFIAAPFLRESIAFWFIDYLIVTFLAVDLAARALASRSKALFFLKPIVLVDVFILLTLLVPLFFNLGFLRALRLWTLFHSDFFWETVGHKYDDTRWEDVAKALSTLLTFVFVVTGFVYGGFIGRHPDIHGYLDALYFTISTLTTTGFGDVTLPGAWGKILSIIIMLSGVTLFLRLAQAVIRANKVRFPCPSCGLVRHEPDAVHCKACGQLLNIPNEE